MADCESIKQCPFFNDKMDTRHVLTHVYKERYCKGESGECARYVVMKRLGKEHVPIDLYPNETAKAVRIVSSASIDGVDKSSNCECFETCDLFNTSISKLPSTSKSFQDKFCHLNHKSCARYMVFEKLGKDEIPKDLFPNERGRALELIGAVG